MRRAFLPSLLAAMGAVMAASSPAMSDPLRLRADALATTASPAGLLVLETDAVPRPGMSAEAVVWMAGQRSPGEDVTGDVLVIAVRARSKHGRANAQLGRFVSNLGALRPVHVDGASARFQLPQRLGIEAVAGVPVVLGLGTGRAWDWMTGARVSRRLGDGGSVGIAIAEQRDAGRLTMEELGVDAGSALGARDDVAARFAYDLANPGIAEVSASASHRKGGVRIELYARHRAASHLLPATSLFSVIGDVPAQRAGTVVTWKAAPRLDLIGDVALRRVDSDFAEELVGRARLRLDDRGTSTVGGELRRSGGSEGWTGARATARIGLPHKLAVSSELELVIPDEARGRGAVWPWALVAASWEHQDWQAAVAIEASASPEYRHRVDGLLQLSRRWSMK